MQKGVATVAQLENFDEIIDARTPAEFEEDHIPGSINLPVLDNEQRIIVGTTYKQKSAFEARRIGGAPFTAVARSAVASAAIRFLLPAVGFHHLGGGPGARGDGIGLYPGCSPQSGYRGTAPQHPCPRRRRSSTRRR